MAESTAPRKRVYLQEVVTRDGFQGLDRFVPTETKIGLINELGHTGLAKIEVTSFVSAAAIPNLRDANEVMAGITRQAGVEYAVLVPNLRGAEHALPHRPDELNLVMSASETNNLMNLRMTREQSFKQLAEIVKFVSSSRVAINISLSTSFGCPVEGVVSEDTVLGFVERFRDLGVRSLTLADTTGMANPAQVETLVSHALARADQTGITLHFHNTRGMGLANVCAGLRAGAVRFDASLGGLGGCPYAPGATGNICTEDTAHMLELMGCETGIDVRRLIEISRRLPEITGSPTPGQVAKAGTIFDLHPAPAWLADVRARAAAR
jgi:hydroxymethylglutaryl-CoA lyase